jgi:hypothetical protein
LDDKRVVWVQVEKSGESKKEARTHCESRINEKCIITEECCTHDFKAL